MYDWPVASSIVWPPRWCGIAIAPLCCPIWRRIACTRIGGPLLFGRLWERLGIAEVLGELLQDRGFEFAVERAVFASVLHRLFVSGSDRSCEKWMAGNRIAGIDGLRINRRTRRSAIRGAATNASKNLIFTENVPLRY
jgi:hypothetical protein